MTIKDEVVIPNDSIRFRIIANSNSISDQSTKTIIKQDIIKVLTENIGNNNSIEEARYKIKKTIPKLKDIIKNYNINYDISFGNNYFPQKNYKGITYNAGNYESLVVTLGKGIGDNFWCVLYPPLCLIEQDENLSENIYKSYIKEVILKNNNK